MSSIWWLNSSVEFSAITDCQLYHSYWFLFQTSLKIENPGAFILILFSLLSSGWNVNWTKAMYILLLHPLLSLLSKRQKNPSYSLKNLQFSKSNKSHAATRDLHTNAIYCIQVSREEDSTKYNFYYYYFYFIQFYFSCSINSIRGKIYENFPISVLQCWNQKRNEKKIKLFYLHWESRLNSTVIIWIDRFSCSRI